MLFKQVIGKNEQKRFSFHFDELQRLLQYSTDAQFKAHFFLQIKGRLQTGHILNGRFSFITPCMMYKRTNKNCFCLVFKI
jgi:hypothetical protein